VDEETKWGVEGEEEQSHLKNNFCWGPFEFCLIVLPYRCAFGPVVRIHVLKFREKKRKRRSPGRF
jgi:hypothetical protein